MTSADREHELLDWLKPQAMQIAGSRISSMRMAGGVDYRQAEAQTVAWQTEFPTLDAAREWSAGHFATIAAEFELHFGPEAMVFTSIFKQLWP